MVKFYESDKIDYSDSVKNYHLAETLGWSKQ